MPQGNGPPPITLPQGVFNALKAMTYSSTAKAFVNGSNVSYFLFVNHAANGAPEWFYGTISEGANHPKGEIPPGTGAAISGGSYDSQTGAVSYNGDDYMFRLERDASGTHIAFAYTV